MAKRKTPRRSRTRERLSKFGSGRIGTMLFHGLKVVAAPISFFEQISEKDRATLGSTYSDASTLNQLKMILNITTGRVAGIQVFKKIDGKNFQ